MANVELLSAISDMLDAKFEAFEKKMDAKMDAKLAPISERLERIEHRLDGLEQRMENVEKRLDSLEQRMENVEKRLDNVEKNLHKLTLLAENVIIPRLREMESCYLSTYERYKQYCERLESLFNDVEILKITVHEHSIRLRLTS